MKKLLLIACVCWTSLISPLQAQVVSTLAGSGSPGAINGAGAAASFYYPFGVTTDGLGNVYVAEGSNNIIRKITSTGVVSTFAGSGMAGYANGTGTAAKFRGPGGMTIDVSGNMYVTDKGNSLIRMITPTGEVSTWAGSGTWGFANGTGTAAMFYTPDGIAVDGAGNLYVADSQNNMIRKISPTRVVSTFAGSGVAGSTDGIGTAASFRNPTGVAIDGSGNVYVVDGFNHLIRKITPAGVVSTFAGSGSAGSTDGIGTAATFKYPTALAIDGSDNIYVADRNNQLIRKITPAGVVSTLAGSGSEGYANGTGTSATFYNPQGIAVDGSGNVYVADQYNHLIRKITGISTGAVEVISISAMKLYPVPANQSITLELILQNDGNLKVDLINISGIKVAGVEGNYSSGFNELTLSVGTLPAGIYVVNVYFNGQVKSQKILIES